MNKFKFLIPILLFTACFLFINQFSCSKDKNSPLSLFGNTDESPLKSELRGSKAHEIQDAFQKIFELYKDSTVFITTEQLVRVQTHPFFDDPQIREFFGNRGSTLQKRTGLGTGFILSKDGYICTNSHVVADMDKVFVTINEKTYDAIVVGADKKTDIALLKVNADDLKPVYFGDSDKVNVGDWAIAIGNPFGLDKTFTVGVISAVGRSDVDMLGSSHIQTDASINPGNSGGPLINIYGEVVGINRMIYSKSGGFMGIGFAIPINTAHSILALLKEHKQVRRGYLGVSILNLTERNAAEMGLAEAKGAFVGEVIAGSPADTGGMKVGDVILDLGGAQIKTYKDLLSIIERSQVGQSMKVTVWRKRQKLNLFVTLKERP
ncbi:MAG: trypsin-like peptidase domain-containing protein [Spirochaetia bacterium]|jgi:Do/DeqQ family serine protease|nr:trypsin-like peptidase domain-containing protein [Spirochaetia bacterium]